MSQPKSGVLAFALACTAINTTAQAATADELAAIRQQIEVIRTQYETRLADLEKKLSEAERRLESAEHLPLAAQSPRASSVAPSGLDTSLILQGQFARMKDVAERNPTGFLPAGHEHGGDKRGFSTGHSELVLAANIDPYWRGKAVFALTNDQTVEVEEASFQRIGSDDGVGFKTGRFRSGIGYLNEQHPHAWDFVDAPLVYQALFGRHGAYTQEGVQLKWLAPLDDLALTFGAEAGRGVSFPATERNKNRQDSAALFAKLGGDLGASNSWQAGVSYLLTSATDREGHLEDASSPAVESFSKFSGKSQLWLADFVWKWAPDGNPSYRNFTFQTEVFARREDGDMACTNGDSGTSLCANQLGNYRSQQDGWYAQAVYQFMPRWRVGYRVDQLNSGTPSLNSINISPDNAFLQPYKPRRDSVMLDYRWSEFSRARLQLSQDKSMAGMTDNQLFLQYIMSLGAHGAHKF